MRMKSGQIDRRPCDILQTVCMPIVRVVGEFRCLSAHFFPSMFSTPTPSPFNKHLYTQKQTPIPGCTKRRNTREVFQCFCSYPYRLRSCIPPPPFFLHNCCFRPAPLSTFLLSFLLSTSDIADEHARAYTHTRTCVRIHTHASAHTHTHTHTHTRVPAKEQKRFCQLIVIHCLIYLILPVKSSLGAEQRLKRKC